MNKKINNPMSGFIESIVTGNMASWRSGYEEGYDKGYLAGLKKAQEISKEVFKKEDDL